MSNAGQTGSAWRWGFPALLLLVPFLGWPLAALVAQGIAPDGTITGSAILDVAGSGEVQRRIAFTAAQALASSALSLVVGLPAAYVVSQIRFPGRRLVRAALTLPLVLPAVVVAVAFRQLLDGAGWVSTLIQRLTGPGIDSTGTLWAILAAHTVFGMAITVRLVGAAWAGLDPRHEEAAQMLGATRWGAFRRITLPAIRPAIGAAATIAFAFAFTSFAIVLILGAARYDTLEVAIYRLATQPGQLPQAAVLSLAQLAVTLVALTLCSTLPGTSRPPERSAHAPLSRTSWRERAALLFVLGAVLALIAIPLAALVAGSVTRDGALTGDHFRALSAAGSADAIAPIESVRWSLAFAFGATALALLAGGVAARAVPRARGWRGAILLALLVLPVAVPGVALGLSVQLAFDRGWYDLRGTPALVLIAHALLAYPFVLRSVVPAARSMDPGVAEAAAVLGASPRRAWRHIDLPVLSRALVAGGAFAFAVSLGEPAATALLRRHEFTTAPVAILDTLGRSADGAGAALALATLLLVVSVVAFLIIERFRHREAGDW
ncbi:MAG: ABC transporter permease subunit [Dehalococcoidia bacterium]